MAQRAAVKEKWGELTCAFCQGKGRDPFMVPSFLSNCGTCGGTGKIRVKEPYVPCRTCGGTGRPTLQPLRLSGLRGKGCAEHRGARGDLPCLRGQRYRWVAPLLPALSRQGGGPRQDGG